jgi:hypothetical protein
MVSSTAPYRSVEVPKVLEDHCWHIEDVETIQQIRPVPELFPLICCQCGCKHSALMQRQTLPGHGRFVRLNQLVYPKRQPCFPKE